jgi:hypothetical protein
VSRLLRSLILIAGTQLFPEYGKLTTGLLGEGTKRASWHLQLLVTEPQRGEHEGQGRGLGTALLKEVEQHVRTFAQRSRTPSDGLMSGYQTGR